MNLVVFDIDGTLTNTNEVDNRCYQETFARMFGYEPQPRDMHGMEHVTDPGILEGLLKSLSGKGPTEAETDSFKADYFGRLKKAYLTDPQAFAPIPGARETISHLRSCSGWTVALATGAWQGSALFKLGSAGIDINGIPLATSDDAISRTGIIKKALERARQINPGAEYEKIVSVGDGRWDVEAARKLGLSFIGIGEKDQLIGWGASEARIDLRDEEEFIGLLEKARPVRGTGG